MTKPRPDSESLDRQAMEQAYDLWLRQGQPTGRAALELWLAVQPQAVSPSQAARGSLATRVAEDDRPRQF